MKHNATTYSQARSGAVYCPRCVEDNPQHKYVRCSMREDDRCDVCHGDPEIIETTEPAMLEHTSALIF